MRILTISYFFTMLENDLSLGAGNGPAWLLIMALMGLGILSKLRGGR